jgi:hypothetical protein
MSIESSQSAGLQGPVLLYIKSSDNAMLNPGAVMETWDDRFIDVPRGKEVFHVDIHGSTDFVSLGHMQLSEDAITRRKQLNKVILELGL